MNSRLNKTGNLWTLTEIFENNYFSIPNYQRGYLSIIIRFFVAL